MRSLRLHLLFVHIFETINVVFSLNCAFSYTYIHICIYTLEQAKFCNYSQHAHLFAVDSTNTAAISRPLSPPNASDTDPRLSGTVRQAATDPTSAPDSVPTKVEQKLEIRNPNNGWGPRTTAVVSRLRSLVSSSKSSLPQLLFQDVHPHSPPRSQLFICRWATLS